MGRKKELRGQVLISLIAIGAFASCTVPVMVSEDRTVNIACTEMECRSADPDENLVSDISVIIFDEQGNAEDSFWSDKGISTFETRLIIGKAYTICACANFGYRVYADNISDLEKIRFHLAYPDDYRQGMPMYAREEIVIGADDTDIRILLKRLMAKISLQMDRRHLSDDVEIFVRRAEIGNCPRSSSVFIPNKVHDEDECFPVGFLRNEMGTDNLNSSSENGLSKSVSLYMLENMQGRMDGAITDDDEKTFDRNDHRRKTCSYIELEMEYQSDDFYSGNKGLIYRFYLGEDRNSLDIERNCHYNITVTMEDDGLSYDSWRVDKSGLNDYGPASLKAYPSGYIVGNIGDRVHIWCEVSPRHTPFDIGISYMEEDKAQGIYDYELDEDGHGATLTLTGPGRGLIYMEAGEPVNDAALFIVEVNLPEVSGSI